MAGTYYKYEPRDPQTELNWAEIGENFTNILAKEREVRAERIKDINASTDAFMANIANKPQGDSTSIREWGLKYGETATKTLQTQIAALKSGDLQLNDFLVNRQNLADGTDQAFSLMQDYQDVYAKKMERMKSQNPDASSQELEIWLMENAEGFADFNRSELYVNPENGKVSVAFKKKNPKTGVMEMSTNPNDLVAVSALKGQLTGEFDKYNVDKATQTWVDGVGAWEVVAKTQNGSRTRAAQILTSVDPMLKRISEEEAKVLGIDPKSVEAINYYIEAEDDYISGQMSNLFNMTSVLTNGIGMKNGQAYTFTFDEEEAKNSKGEVILMERTAQGPQPVFDKARNPYAEEQKDAVYGYMRNAIRNKIDKTSDIKTFNEWNDKSKTDKDKDDKNKKDKNIMSNVSKLYYGDENEVEEAISFIRSANPNIDEIDRDGNSVIVTFLDGTPSETISFTGADNSQLGQEQWVGGAVNFFLKDNDKIQDVAAAIKAGGINNSRTFNSTSTGFGAGESTSTEDLGVAYDRIVREDSGLKPSMFVADDEDKTKTNLIGVVSNLPGLGGYSVDTSGAFDNITISDADGNVVKTFSLDASDGFSPAQATKFVDELLSLSKEVHLGGAKDQIATMSLLVGDRAEVTKDSNRTSSRRKTPSQTTNPTGVGSKY